MFEASEFLKYIVNVRYHSKDPTISVLKWIFSETFIHKFYLNQECSVEGTEELCRFNHFPFYFQGHSKLMFRRCGVWPTETPGWNQMKHEKVSLREQTMNCV